MRVVIILISLLMIAALGVNYILNYDKRRMSLMLIADILSIAVMDEALRATSFSIFDNILFAFYTAYAITIALGDFVLWRITKNG